MHGKKTSRLPALRGLPRRASPRRPLRPERKVRTAGRAGRRGTQCLLSIASSWLIPARWRSSAAIISSRLIGFPGAQRQRRRAPVRPSQVARPIVVLLVARPSPAVRVAHHKALAGILALNRDLTADVSALCEENNAQRISEGRRAPWLRAPAARALTRTILVQIRKLQMDWASQCMKAVRTCNWAPTAGSGDFFEGATPGLGIGQSPPETLAFFCKWPPKWNTMGVHGQDSV
jgi:hypothetical protein